MFRNEFVVGIAAGKTVQLLLTNIDNIALVPGGAAAVPAVVLRPLVIPEEMLLHVPHVGEPEPPAILVAYPGALGEEAGDISIVMIRSNVATTSLVIAVSDWFFLPLGRFWHTMGRTGNKRMGV